MFEKKKLMINCEFCDATKIKEEDYSRYEEITLNTGLLVTDEKSRSILNGMHITMNVEKVLEIDSSEKCHFQVVNGSHEIGKNAEADKGTILVVNGALSVLPGNPEALSGYRAILVNGSITCPRNVWEKRGDVTVNGAIATYPEDCTVLNKKFTMDPYFPARAKENGRYYAEKRVVIADEKIDAALLARKGVQFVTQELLVLEKKAEEALSLVDETVKFTVIPQDYAYVQGNVTLDEGLLQKYGKKLFICGDLSTIEMGDRILPQLEGLKVTGKVRLRKKDLELLGRIDAEYGKLELVRGRDIWNAVNVSIDAAALEREPDGISIWNVATVKLAEDLSPEMIMERLEIRNAGKVLCSEAQESAVAMICQNAGHIGKDKEVPGLQDIADTKTINAAEYVL